MTRLPSLWVPLVAFVLGLIGGVVLDRSIGGPGGLTVGLLVLIVPGTLAFAGPLAQQYWGNRFTVEQRNRELFRQHADLLLSRVLWAASQAQLSYDVEGYRWQAQGGYSVNVPTDGGSASLEELVQWSIARPHLLSEPRVRPLLENLEQRVAQGQAAKERLDQKFVSAFNSALKTKARIDADPATPTTGWTDWPPAAVWYPEPVVRALRQRRARNTFTLRQVSINHSTGEEPTPVDQVEMNSQLVVQVVGRSSISANLVEEAYELVRADADLQRLTETERTRAAEDAGVIREFAGAVRAYAELVEASEKHLLGECPACAHLHPR